LELEHLLSCHALPGGGNITGGCSCSSIAAVILVNTTFPTLSGTTASESQPTMANKWPNELGFQHADFDDERWRGDI
jgi:hypothetical protein